MWIKAINGGGPNEILKDKTTKETQCDCKKKL